MVAPLTDQIIVLVFFVSLFVLGAVILLRYKFMKKEKTFIAADTMLAFYLVVGLLGTEMIHGFQTVGMPGLIYLFGIGAMWYFIAVASGFSIAAPVAWYIKKGAGVGKLTIPETVEVVLGPKVSGAVAIIFSIFCLLCPSFTAIIPATKVLPVFAGWSILDTMIIIAIVSVGYVVISGFWGAAWLGLFQLVLIYIGFAVAAFFAITAAGGWGAIVAAAPPTHWEMFPGPLGWEFVATFVLFFMPFTYAVAASTGRGMLAAKNPKHSFWGGISSTLVYIPFMFLILLIGLSAVALFPLGTPQALADSELALSMVLMNTVPQNGLLGFTFIGPLAAMITTSAVMLFIGSTTLSHDIYKRFIRPNASDRELNWLARVIMIIAALANIPLCYAYGLWITYALTTAYAVSIATCPAALLGFFAKYTKVTPNGVFVGLIVGAVVGTLVSIYWPFWGVPIAYILTIALSLGISWPIRYWWYPRKGLPTDYGLDKFKSLGQGKPTILRILMVAFSPYILMGEMAKRSLWKIVHRQT